jgi:hypothetical protein
MINNNQDQTPERQGESPSGTINRPKGSENQEMIKGVNHSVDSLGLRMSVDGVVGAENAEKSEGFSESELKGKGKGTPKGQKQDDQDAAQQIAADLQKKAKPITRKSASRIIKIAVHQEMTAVEKKVKKLTKNSLKNAYALSEAVKTLKKLRFILQNLAHWTFEALKSLVLAIRSGKKLSTVPLPQ